MKRKQFHLSPLEERLLQQMAEDTDRSEAEVVREAIRQYGYKKKKSPNVLVQMAKQAAQEASPAEHDLAEAHDKYLMEIIENEK
ncbi:ribbon-helix-helix protein, CopG family [Salibacterium aidingense]|uniref:ribbon-helix-helix protein, CopG family n=1 Tax=Salibacterium aidingense TaxID=384933 RepID=UPI000409C8DB|nr:ribbon-helix-helix protein, CopG family [Salibacterium aidingense]